MRFDISDNVAAATPEVKLLYDVTDNPTYNASEGTEPVVKEWLTGFVVSARAATMVEVGLAKADRTGFAPAFAVHLAAGVPFEYQFPNGRPILDMSDADVKRLALRLSPVADATPLKVAGTVEIAQV